MLAVMCSEKRFREYSVASLCSLITLVCDEWFFLRASLCVLLSQLLTLSLSVGATLLIKTPIFSHLFAAYYLIARLTSSVSSAINSPTIPSLEVPQLELINKKGYRVLFSKLPLNASRQQNTHQGIPTRTFNVPKRHSQGQVGTSVLRVKLSIVAALLLL